MGSLFNESMGGNERTWIYFKNPLKQEQTLLCQSDTFELVSV